MEVVIVGITKMVVIIVTGIIGAVITAVPVHLRHYITMKLPH